MGVSFGFMQAVDRHAGLAACAALSAACRFRRGPAPPPPEPDQVRRLLCIKFWGLGSLLLLRPAVASLRARFPSAEFHVLTLDRNRDLCARLGVFDRIHTLEVDGGPAAVIGRILRLLARLRDVRPDIVVDFEFFTRFSAIVTAWTGAPWRAGFRAWEIWRGTLHNVTVPLNRYWHVTENFLSLARALGAGDPPAPEPPSLSPEDEAGADRLIEERGIGRGERLVLVNVNSGELALERRWPAHRFAGFLRELPRRAPVTVLLIGSPSERDYVETVRQAADAGPRVVNVAGGGTLGAVMALMRRAELLVTNDSGPLHMAAAMGLRTVLFFGPETPVLYGPRGDGHRVIFRNLPCSPCINVHDLKRVRCIFDRPRCLHEIPEAEALKETLAALDSARPARI